MMNQCWRQTLRDIGILGYWDIAILRWIAVLLVSCTFLSCQPKSSTLILAHGLDTKHPMHLAFVRLGDALDSISDGQMQIDIYHSAQLGAEREVLELLQLGSVDITKVSAAVMEGFVPQYKVLSIPYIFKSREHSFELLDGEAGQMLLYLSESARLKGLCFYDAGARSFYTIDHMIKTPADLSGLKIRVQKSEMAVNLVKSLDASPTPISWGELYTALQSGVVDGAENNPPSFYSSHHYEVCKYYSLNEHTRIPDVLLISLHSWNKLSEQEQEWLTIAVKISVDYQRKLWAEAELDALKKVQDAGAEIYYPDKESFAKPMSWMIEDMAEDPQFEEVLKLFEANE